MRILVFHAGALGDFILTLQFVRHITHAFQPKPRITVVARSPLARFAAGRSIVDTAHDFDVDGWHTLFTPHGVIDERPVRILDGSDLVLSFCGGQESVFISRLRTVVNCPIAAIDPRIRPETHAAARHITRQWCDDLNANRPGALPPIEMMNLNQPPLLIPDEPDRLLGRQRWLHDDKSTRKPRIVIHPGSGGASKCWPINKFEQFASRMILEGHTVAWMIGPVELDMNGDDYRRQLEQVAPVFYEEQIAAAASILAESDVYLGNDSGMTHLAAALGIRTYALFGPTSGDVWCPAGPDVHRINFQIDPFGLDIKE